MMGSSSATSPRLRTNDARGRPSEAAARVGEERVQSRSVARSDGDEAQALQASSRFRRGVRVGEATPERAVVGKYGSPKRRAADPRVVRPRTHARGDGEAGRLVGREQPGRQRRRTVRLLARHVPTLRVCVAAARARTRAKKRSQSKKRVRLRRRCDVRQSNVRDVGVIVNRARPRYDHRGRASFHDARLRPRDLPEAGARVQEQRRKAPSARACGRRRRCRSSEDAHGVGPRDGPRRGLERNPARVRPPSRRVVVDRGRGRRGGSEPVSRRQRVAGERARESAREHSMSSSRRAGRR